MLIFDTIKQIWFKRNEKDYFYYKNDDIDFFEYR